MNIKQEFGKWFLDVAKYVVTALLLSSMIEGLSQWWIMGVSVSVALLCLLFGGVLLKKGKDEEERRRERNRNKNKRKG